MSLKKLSHYYILIIVIVSSGDLRIYICEDSLKKSTSLYLAVFGNFPTDLKATNSKQKLKSNADNKTI